jgi:hypothetical protein
MLPAQTKIKPEITHNISMANPEPLPYFYRLFSTGHENKPQSLKPENYCSNGIIPQ